MLTQPTVNNFANAALSNSIPATGMTCITGETGRAKSIATTPWACVWGAGRGR